MPLGGSSSDAVLTYGRGLLQVCRSTQCVQLVVNAVSVGAVGVSAVLNAVSFGAVAVAPRTRHTA
jgi:hypothetical protein